MVRTLLCWDSDEDDDDLNSGKTSRLCVFIWSELVEIATGGGGNLSVDVNGGTEGGRWTNELRGDKISIRSSSLLIKDRAVSRTLCSVQQYVWLIFDKEVNSQNGSGRVCYNSVWSKWWGKKEKSTESYHSMITSFYINPSTAIFNLRNLIHSLGSISAHVTDGYQHSYRRQMTFCCVIQLRMSP